MVAYRRMRLRRRDSGFRRNGRWETVSIKRISIPAKAGISRGGIVRHASPTGDIGFRFAEFPADAGRDSRFRENGRWEAASIKRISIPAKAGISFSRQREFSAKRNIAMVACRRMRLRRRDSGFRRNGRWETASIKIIPIPAKAGISLSSNCFEARCQKTVRDSGRFPLSREWECFFSPKEKITPRRPPPAMRLEFRRRYFRRPVWGRARF